jgi:FtsZ-binding cell division protein ZapB
MKNLKHVGRLKSNNAKVLVVFRTLPGDPYYALVLGTANLSDLYHNALIDLVESDQGQDANEFGQIMSIRYFPDGRPMLAALHQDGKLVKVQTTDILMTPNTVTTIPLSELNMLIAEQKGIALDELAYEVSNVQPEPKPETTPEAVAESVKAEAVVETVEVSSMNAAELRSKADALYKEAAKLRKQADELDPPKKKTVKAKETTDA